MLLASHALVVAGVFPRNAHAQVPDSGRDTVHLGALQGDAIRRDPRAREIELLAAQSELRQRNIDAVRLPRLSVNSQAQYQSDVASIPVRIPGVDIPMPPHDTYDAHIDARQSLFDPATGGRRGVERAQLAESQARVRASLYTLRQNVNESYFTVLRLQSQRSVLQAAMTDLDAQLQMTRRRVTEGTSLPSEAAALEAELLKRRQSVNDMTADRDAALAVLADLAGRAISPRTSLALPDLSNAVASARASVDGLRARPEYEQFARSRDVLDQQRASVSARDLPRISAFSRAGYGRPGLNPLAKDFDSYWIAGVQLEWTPWSWGATRREREVLSLQQQIVSREEQAFSEGVRRSVVHDLASIDRLAHALEEDDAIIILREEVLREARLRYGERVITSAEYVDRQTDVVTAQLSRASHRVELAWASARFLTSLGLEVR